MDQNIARIGVKAQTTVDHSNGWWHLPHLYAVELFGSVGEAVIEYRGHRYLLHITHDGRLSLACEEAA